MHTDSVPAAARGRSVRVVVLVTDDRNLRVKALAADLPARDLPSFVRWAGLAPHAVSTGATHNGRLSSYRLVPLFPAASTYLCYLFLIFLSFLKALQTFVVYSSVCCCFIIFLVISRYLIRDRSITVERQLCL